VERSDILTTTCKKADKAHTLSFVLSLLIVISLGYIWRDSYIDDAYIGFRCVENFLRGDGLCFNPGERVESVTNIGWLLILVPFTIFMPAHIAGKALGIAFLVFTAALVSKIGSVYDQENGAKYKDQCMRYFLPILVFTSPTLLYYSNSGMETSFLCFLLGLPLLLGASEKTLPYTAIIYGVAFTIRPECLLLFPIYITCFFIIKNNTPSKISTTKKQIVIATFAWFIVIIFASIARYLYFGYLLPNTFYSKQSSWQDVLLRIALFASGKLPNLPLPYSGFFLIPVIFLGCNQLSQKSPTFFPPCFAAACTGCFFSIYAATDWTMTPRYIAPYLPYCIMLILAGLFNNHLVRIREFQKPLEVFYATCFIVFVCSNCINGIAWFGSESTKYYPGYVINSKNLLAPAKKISAIASKNSTIATRRIGLIGYISQCNIFDYKFSLPHKDVVGILRKNKIKYFDMPDNDFLSKVWQSRKPDYILEDFQTIEAIVSKQKSNFADFQLHGIQYHFITKFKIGETEDWMLYAIKLPDDETKNEK
jgi:hypothetical protein